MPSSRDSFRRNRVAPVGTYRIPLPRNDAPIGRISLILKLWESWICRSASGSKYGEKEKRGDWEITIASLIYGLKSKVPQGSPPSRQERRFTSPL